MRSSMPRVAPSLLLMLVTACGGSTPPPKADSSDPGASLGGGTAIASLPPDDGGAAPAPAASSSAPAPSGGLPADVSVVTKGQAALSGLAVDDTSIYFVLAAEGTVMRMNKTGGTSEIFYSSPAPFTGTAFAAVDAKYLFVAAGSVVLAIDKQGGVAPTTLASQVRDPFRAIALDASTVYYVTGDNVIKVSKSGGAPAAVAALQRDVTSVGADGKNVFWSTAGDGMIWRAAARGADVVVRGAEKPGCLAFDDASVYFCSGSKVMKAPKAGGAATALATADSAVTLVTLDGTNAYYATDKGGVGRAPKAGSGAGEVLVPGGGPALSALVVDASNVY